MYKGKSNNAEDVKYLQAYLKKEVGLTDDQIKQDGFGTFGENTDNALMKKFGYKNHGNSVGTKTWGKIGTEDLSTQIKAIDTALNAPVVVATKELAAVTLTDTDLSGVGLELSLDSDGIHLKGTLPAKCVKDGSIQRLALSPVRVDEPSIDDSEEAANLADRASKLSVSATFTGQEVDGMKNLADCKTKATPSDATTPVDLVATFQDPENGAILVSNNKTLKSKRLLALESLLANCPDCSAAQHRKKLNTILDLENSSYEATAKAHLEAMISDAASTIDNASSLADLEKARNDLISYSSDATRLKGGRDEMLSSIQTQLQRIIDKNE
ncbi:MAG: hypothetical protein EBX52_09585, partial [Proteobacteria bacterium]|nr:hypothetical protein [Pseudomonadota bacterium]